MCPPHFLPEVLPLNFRFKKMENLTSPQKELLSNIFSFRIRKMLLKTRFFIYSMKMFEDVLIFPVKKIRTFWEY